MLGKDNLGEHISLPVTALLFLFLLHVLNVNDDKLFHVLIVKIHLYDKEYILLTSYIYYNSSSVFPLCSRYINQGEVKIYRRIPVQINRCI